jgi:hypothetical protein
VQVEHAHSLGDAPLAVFSFQTRLGGSISCVAFTDASSLSSFDETDLRINGTRFATNRQSLPRRKESTWPRPNGGAIVAVMSESMPAMFLFLTQDFRRRVHQYNIFVLFLTVFITTATIVFPVFSPERQRLAATIV